MMHALRTEACDVLVAKVLAMFLDCEQAGMHSWPGSGWPAPTDVTGMPLALHCPNASTVAEVRGAVARGDIFFHAFPHNAEVRLPVPQISICAPHFAPFLIAISQLQLL